MGPRPRVLPICWRSVNTWKVGIKISLPLTLSAPRSFRLKKADTRSWVLSLTRISPQSAIDIRRAAMLMSSPMRVYSWRWSGAPALPAKSEAGVDADALPEAVDAGIGLERGKVGAGRGLHVEGGVHGPHRVVLVGAGRAKKMSSRSPTAYWSIRPSVPS